MKHASLLVAVVAGTLTMFFWGATEWFNPLLHIPYHIPQNPSVVNQTLNEHMPEAGMYIWPHGPGAKTEEGEAKDIVYFMAKNDAAFYQPGRFMIVELITQLVTWTLIVYLLLRVKLVGHWQRVGFVVALGLLAGCAYLLPMGNWWGFSVAYVAIRWMNLLVGWFLAGSAVSYVLRKQFTTS